MADNSLPIIQESQLTDTSEIAYFRVLDTLNKSRKIAKVNTILPGTQISVGVEGINATNVNDAIAELYANNTIFPDIPENRVTLKRYSGQTSTIPVITDNTDLIDIIKATAFPVLIDRTSHIVNYLNGNDVRKTSDGNTADLTNWQYPAMVRLGGIWMKYTYNATTNEKIFQFSPFKVRGYKYIRRRYLNMYGGYVYNDGTTNYLTSIAGKWTKQNVSTINFHAYAKNMGTYFREISTEDREVYRFYFWLLEQNFNSQSLYAGITNADYTKWSTFNQTGLDGAGVAGQSTYGQFHLTGVTNSISGHKGEASVNIVYGSSETLTVKPNKWLWRENMLAGPYWIWETGYLFLGNKVYKAKDINNITVAGITADNIATYYDYIGDMNSASGYILENLNDSLIPTLVGGSSTTGHADYSYRPSPVVETTIYVPAGVGDAFDGSSDGVSVLYSRIDASSAHASFGGALASDDPTDAIADGTIAA